MSCIRKDRTGSCDHFQCPYSQISGYECVDVAGIYCEVGLNCVKQCAYSFTEDEQKEASKAFDDFSFAL